MMEGYPESYLAFMRECRAAYLDVCEAIEDGDVAAGATAKITIEIPVHILDQIRFERLAAIAETA